MSQVIKNLASGPVPPAVATSFVTDVNSPAIPDLNILNVPGGTTTANVANGIRTDGSSGSNTLTIQLTNRLAGAVVTTNATPTTLLTFPLGVAAGSYFFTVTMSAYDRTDTATGGYEVYGTFRTDGVTAVLVGDSDSIVHEDPALVAVDFEFVASANNALFQVTGIAAKTISWVALLTYQTAS